MVLGEAIARRQNMIDACRDMANPGDDCPGLLSCNKHTMGTVLLRLIQEGTYNGTTGIIRFGYGDDSQFHRGDRDGLGQVCN